MRAACLEILESKDAPVDDFRDMIGFIRNYADKHHHGKEEQILFKAMTGHLGHVGENLITHGMLVEHDLARLYISDLEAALNEYEVSHAIDAKLGIIANAVGYANLLARHIDKENTVVYPYAEAHLPPDVLAGADAGMREAERQAEENGVQRKYLAVLAALERKYGSRE